MPLDLTLSPLYRINGQEIASLPGLVAVAPPPNAARGREKDRLIAYLLLTGNSTFSTSEYLQVAKDAANLFYQTPGAQTSALRAAAELANKTLLERNMATSGKGQYAIGWLTLAAVREAQCTLALSGPMHVFWFGQNEIRHIHEPITSGKGLGSNQITNIYYAQTALASNDRLLLFGRAPEDWNPALNDHNPSSMDAMRRRLTTMTSADLNAVLMQATDGTGALNLLSGVYEPKAEEKEQPAPAPISRPTLRPEVLASLPRRDETRETSAPKVDSPPAQPQPTPEPLYEEQPADVPSAHVVQPSAYAIPQQYEETPPINPLSSLPRNTSGRDFPASIPRTQPGTTGRESASSPLEMDGDKVTTPAQPELIEASREPSELTRQTAKALATSIQTVRRVSGSVGERIKNFLPRLLPSTETADPTAPSNTTMFFMTILIALMVVTMLSVVYLRFGVSQQYEAYLVDAQRKQAQARALTNPVEQRQAWENVLDSVKAAEKQRTTSETTAIREEANANLDKLLGISRMQFNPAFSTDLGIEISRMAASETDLYLLDAKNGEAFHAQPSGNGRGLQLDTTFSCKQGVYGNYTVGALVDIATLPPLNLAKASLLGIDGAGNLLYCAPGQVPQAIPLPPPDTNWNRVTAMTLDGGNLYVLDALSRAVWVYNGKDSQFIDRPYFFFGGQTPEKQDVIDFIVSGDDMYMLHGDGHISTCSYSRIASRPTRCEDPVSLVNPFPAYQDSSPFANAHFTQILFAALPDQSVLLLDADAQSILRFAPHSFELQNQFRPILGTENPVMPGPVGAVAVSPNHVLYLAVGGQVYFALEMQ